MIETLFALMACGVVVCGVYAVAVMDEHYEAPLNRAVCAVIFQVVVMLLCIGLRLAFPEAPKCESPAKGGEVSEVK